MNSYNENLHTTIVGSLQSLDLEQQTLKSQVNASMFTLYHAEGATITAQQNLSAAIDAFGLKAAVQDEAVKGNNLSVNVLGSATQANLYVKQSITNVAVCAASVQVAANSILRLASDVSSIFSIVNAADFDSDIYFQAENARELMNHTAYDAEVASQLAMEASMLTAEISAATVLDMTKATNTLMGTVLKVTSADFDTVTQELATDSAALGSVRSTEKLDEGALEMVSVAYKATKSAYRLTNRELNLNLHVNTSTENDLSFTVHFHLIKSPFSLEEIASKPLYPVKEYYMIVVKESKKQTFSISNAENLFLKDNTEVIKVLPPKTSQVSQLVNVYSNTTAIGILPVTDSDNDEITMGVSYVVFVMAILDDDYKRKINCYDDYLSAPSQAFSLTTRLKSIHGNTIKVKHFKESDLTEEELALATSSKNEQQRRNAADLEDSGIVADYTYVLTFNSEETLDTEIEYRCMLLPLNPDIADNLLTSESLKFLMDNEIASLEKIANEIDPQINELQAGNYETALKIQLLGEEQKSINDQLDALTKNTGATAGEDEEKQQSLKVDLETLNTQIKDLQKIHDSNLKSLESLKKHKDKASKSLVEIGAAKPGFIFNVPIAEQVYADSYTVARKQSDTADGSPAQWITFFGPDTTDNFGNRLKEKGRYLPVILSYSTAAEENAADFVNALSEIATTPYFEYLTDHHQKK